MKRFIVYLFILCITLLAAIVTGGASAIFLLGFELLLPTFLYLLILYFSKNIQVCIELSVIAAKGEEIPVKICLKNKGRLPISRVEAQVICRDAFDSRRIIETMNCVIDARGESYIQMGMRAQYAGRLEFQIGRVKVYDYFHLLSKKVPYDKEWRQMVITPDIYPIGIEGTTDVFNEWQSGELHSVDRSGDDVSEVHDVRAFRAGDTLHKVHWKLSAKTEELLVKEFSGSMKNTVFVFIDLFSESHEEWTHECFDRMMGMLASLSHYLLLREQTHEVFWYDDGEGTLHSVTIAKEEDIYEAVGELSGVKTYDVPYDFQMVQKENGIYGQQTRAFHVDTKCNLFLDERRIASMTGNNIRMEWI
ncbi:MAG: DUF58 domain-containing protein [Lachnospiraceae bacterium]|nr:DUF58 domain-containing protein [Lachnospiraceae bacterium]